jgi:hypothetical protein
MNHTITIPPLPTSVIAVSHETVRTVLGLVTDAVALASPKNPEQAEQARAVLVKIQKLKTAVDKERKAQQLPFDEIVDQIRAVSKEVVQPLEQAQELIKAGLGNYILAEQQAAAARMAEIAKAQTAEIPEGRSTPALPVMAPPPRQAALSTYQHRNITIIDETVIPRAYLMVNMQKLTAAIDAGVQNIPGICVTFETRVASR